MYVIDSDALITAFRYDFPPRSDPGGFWNWLNEMAGQGQIVIPEAVFDEIGGGTDDLYELLIGMKNINKEPTANALQCISQVLEAYDEDLSEIDLEQIDGADPYIIAHAMGLDAVVVTNEVPNNATVPRNKKIPNICESLNVSCMRYPRFLWEMRGK